MNELLRASVERPDTRYAYIAPFRKQAKDTAWDKVLKVYGNKVPGVSFNESELRCDLPNGSDIQLFGGENAHGLRGMHLDGVVLDEFAQMRPNLFKEVVFPALQRKTGFAMFIGTPLGRNHFYELWQYARQAEGWHAEMWPATRSDVFTLDQLEDFKRIQGPDLYAQEYECSWEAAIEGAYYARSLEASRAGGRLCRVAWEPTVPVDTWWDLGFADATAIIFGQRVGREVHLIDYLESRGQDLAYYAAQLQNRPYLYGTHTLPHDAGAAQLGAAGRTIAEQLQALGVKGCQVLGQNDPLDGINQARLVFPRLWFDEDKCGPLLNALANYREQWDADKRASTGKPLHDWSSHAADALRYLAVSLKDFKAPHGPQAPRGPTKTAFDVYTWNRPKGKSKTAFHV